MTKKLTYEYVKQCFEERGCLLLSKEYVRAKDKLRFKCSCGNTADIAFEKFQSGQLCRKCSYQRSSAKTRHSYKYVRSYFQEHGCALVSKEYLGNKQRLEYVCECGEVSRIAFAKFQAGQRCYRCRNRKIKEGNSGENSPNWKADRTDEERIKDRSFPGYQEWRKNVFERDDYTCQNCLERGGTLNAHHIESYAKNPELRTELSNGITLCGTCHKEYHKNYYRNDATKESFGEYMRGEHDCPWYAGEEIEQIMEAM